MKAKIEYKSFVIEQGSISLVNLKEDGTYSETVIPCDFTRIEEAQKELDKNSLIKEFCPAQKKELDMGGYYDILPEDIQTFEDILSRAKFKPKTSRCKQERQTLECLFDIDKAVEQLKGSTGEE